MNDEAVSPAPLPVDPEVLSRIVRMRPAHVPDVCRLHRADMGHSLWARLGEGFLRRVYASLLEDPDFLGFVYLEDGRPRGFIAGTADGPRMFRRVALRHAAALAAAAVRGVLRDPGALRPLLQTALYFRRSAPEAARRVEAESFFCSFAPDLRGKKISGLINKVLFDELLARGHAAVRITTEADNRGAVRQLTSWGFQRMASFRFYGKDMVTWELDLARCERVDGSTAGRP